MQLDLRPRLELVREWFEEAPASSPTGAAIFYTRIGSDTARIAVVEGAQGAAQEYLGPNARNLHPERVDSFDALMESTSAFLLDLIRPAAKKKTLRWTRLCGISLGRNEGCLYYENPQGDLSRVCRLSVWGRLLPGLGNEVREVNAKALQLGLNGIGV
jgi:hypothetical protein